MGRVPLPAPFLTRPLFALNDCSSSFLHDRPAATNWGAQACTDLGLFDEAGHAIGTLGNYNRRFEEEAEPVGTWTSLYQHLKIPTGVFKSYRIKQRCPLQDV